MSHAVHDELARCVIQLLLKEPFFGHLLGSVARAVNDGDDGDDGTPTVAVSQSGGRVTLSVNPVFFMKSLQGAPERVAVVKHEALHLLFRHLFRRDPARHHPVMFNLAADLVVNQFIGPPWKLPDDAITLKTFPDLGLAPDQTLEWYYDRLDALAQRLDKGGGGSGTPSPKSAHALRRILADPRWHSDHGRWSSGTSADEAVASADLDRAVAQARDRAGPRGWSALPNPLRELITAAIERRAPKLDWRRALRIFSQSTRRTRIAGTLQRKSRRYGTVPGIKVKRLQRMAVVVDTSGSIADTDLSDFFAEVHAMWRQGAEVVVVECDAAVQRTFEYRGSLPKKVGGRGGTSFDPALRWLSESARRTGPWDACVYFTDGGAPAPTVRPPCKLLWIVTRDGNAGPHLKGGRAVKLT